MEAEAGVMHPQAKDHWQPPEEARDRASFKASGRNQPFPHPNESTPSFEAQLAPELQMNNLYIVLNHPVCGLFVTETNTSWSEPIPAPCNKKENT